MHDLQRQSGLDVRGRVRHRSRRPRGGAARLLGVAASSREGRSSSSSAFRLPPTPGLGGLDAAAMQTPVAGTSPLETRRSRPPTQLGTPPEKPSTDARCCTSLVLSRSDHAIIRRRSSNHGGAGISQRVVRGISKWPVVIRRQARHDSKSWAIGAIALSDKARTRSQRGPCEHHPCEHYTKTTPMAKGASGVGTENEGRGNTDTCSDHQPCCIVAPVR